MEIALYCRSGPRSGATRKSGGAVSGRCRKTMERSGARSGGRGAGTEQGAEVTGLGWSVERLFRPLRSAHVLWRRTNFDNYRFLLQHCAAVLWQCVKIFNSVNFS